MALTVASKRVPHLGDFQSLAALLLTRDFGEGAALLSVFPAIGGAFHLRPLSCARFPGALRMAYLRRSSLCKLLSR